MEFHEKLKELRAQRGLTQEEVASAIYVSRTAISKWESGRGYPNIDSLRAIAKFYKITLDDLLSGDELLSLAEADRENSRVGLIDLAFGLVDLCFVLFFFLPLFAIRTDDTLRTASLLALDGMRLYLKIPFFMVVVAQLTVGILTLALQALPSRLWKKLKCPLSLSIGALATLLFIITLQPHAAVFSLMLTFIKVMLLFKHR
jgi:transcriptional regulator with XRE-family HTH domain